MVNIADLFDEAIVARRRTAREPDAGRRRVLGRLAAWLVAPACLMPPSPAAFANEVARAAVGAPRRIVVLDWDLTEIVLSLGVVPVGVARPIWYTQLDGDPPLPDEVVDTGLLYQPNFEVLQRLAPDLIVITAWHAMLRPSLERIAPTLTVTLYAPGVAASRGDAYLNMRTQTRYLAHALGREPQADALLARLDATIVRSATQVRESGAARWPLYALRPIDGRHVTVYGPQGLFDGVMRELGLTNAWQGGTDAQGAAETDLAALAQRPEAGAVLVGMASSGVPPELAQSPLWRALPFVKDGRLHSIGKASPTGGPVSAMRFATQLAGALSGATS
nr:ABC transporter substrate-binding protein [Paraburkholderia bannensis]